MAANARLAAIEADYWDCSEESDRLTHDCPESALEDFVDCIPMFRKGPSLESLIREAGPVKIWPWTRKIIAPGVAEHVADRALDGIVEMLDEDEDYGDPDGEHEILDEATCAKHRPALLAAIQALLADAEPWACERGEPVMLAPEEVIELVREQCPEWFEVAP